MKSLIKKLSFTSVATLLLAGVLAVVTAPMASAHTGDLKVIPVCNTQTGMYDLTAKLTTSNVPSGVTGSSKWRLGTSSFQGTPSSDYGMDRGPVASTGSQTITLGSWSLPGTTTGYGPWVYAYTKWSNGTKRGSDGRLTSQLKGDCKETDKVVEAKALCDHEINSTEWHFVATQVKDEASADDFITVTWDNGQTSEVPLDKFVGGVAHYTTTLNLDANVTKAVMEIYDGWMGEFNLSHGPSCDKTVKVPVPAKPGQNDPCGPNNATWIVPNDTDSLDWTLQSDGRLTVTTKPGYKFEDGTTSKDFGKAVDSNEPCKVPVPAKPTFQDPCGPGNASWNVPADTESLDWTLEADGDLVVATKPGYVFSDGTTSKNYGKAPDSGVKCTVPVPPAPSQNDPCGPNNATWNVPADTADYDWTLRQDGHLVVTVKGDNTFPDGSTSKDYGQPTDSNEPCKVPVPAKPDVNDPCGPNNATWIKPDDTASVVWVIESDGDLVASTTPGYVFEDGTTSKNYGKAVDSNEPCPDKETPVPAAPSQNDPCGPNNATWNVPVDTTSVDWTLRSDGHLMAETKPGYVFEDGSKLKDFGLPTDANVPCATPPPVPPTYTCPPGTTWTDTNGNGAMEPGECQAPTPPKPDKVKPRAKVWAHCVTENFGEGKAVLNNKKSTKKVIFRIVRSGPDKFVKVKAGAKKTVFLTGLHVGSVVKVKVGSKTLAKTKVPRGCSTNTPPPNTGMRMAVPGAA